MYVCIYAGVESVAIKGDAKDQLEVIGEGIDTIGLAKLLRKKVGSADLISVGPAKDEKKNEGDQVVWSIQYPYYGSGGPPYQVYAVRDSYHDPSCSIM